MLIVLGWLLFINRGFFSEHLRNDGTITSFFYVSTFFHCHLYIYLHCFAEELHSTEINSIRTEVVRLARCFEREILKDDSTALND